MLTLPCSSEQPPPLALVPQHFGSIVFDRRTSRYLPFDREATDLLRQLQRNDIDSILRTIQNEERRAQIPDKRVFSSPLVCLIVRIGQGLRFRFSIQSTGMRRSHQDIDARNQLQDHMLASRLRRNTRLLRQARANLRRWQARDGRHPRKVFVEWQRILEHLSCREIADFLVSDTPMARRLRQSSPFLGLF